MKTFKTFIASSLSGDFTAHRESIKKMLTNMSSDEELNMDFTTYLFEEDGCNAACASGAQAEINRHIDGCHAFILICDDNIGKKTVEEFKYALSRFKKGLCPYYITIVKKRGNGSAPNEFQISYKDFEEQFVKFYFYDEDGSVKDDMHNYKFDYDDDEKMLEHLRDDMKRWILHDDHRPLFKAELGREITPDFLYTDQDRKDHCSDNMYFRRPIDDRIDNAMLDEHKQILLIKGSTLSGKTRALYQAIKKCPDAFFYKFEKRRDEQKMQEEIDDITGYITHSLCSSPLYLIFEDVHQLSTDKNVRAALEDLKLAIQDRNIHIIMTSTVTDSRGMETFMKPDETLLIQPLSDNERFQAKQFCRRFGIEVTGVKKAIGAMMIDLGVIADHYNEFLNKEKEEQKRWAKESLLQAVKAFSIWHNTNLGEVKGLYSLTKFLLKTQVNITDDSIVYEAFKDFKKLRGINDCSNGNNFKIDARRKLPEYFQIEEYIYREILSFSGGVCRGDSDNSLEDELELIGYILKFVHETKKESIIVCLAKLARRTEHRDEIARIIYNLVTKIYTPNYKPESNCIPADWEKAPWYNVLKEELEEIKKDIPPGIDVDAITLDSREEVKMNFVYLSKIIWANQVFARTFDEAYEIFCRTEEPLQSMAMLGALITKCEDENPERMAKNFEQLKEIGKLRRDEVKNSFYIINKALPYYKDFSSAYECFNKGIRPYNDDSEFIAYTRKFRESLHRREHLDDEIFKKDFARNQMVHALNTLAQKVTSYNELMLFAGIIRENYVVLTENLDLAESFIHSSDQYNRKSLTLVDLLATLRLHGLRGAVSNLFEWNGKTIPEDAIDFVDRHLIPQFIMTLNSNTTPRYKAKYTVATILNLFIEKCSECHYNDIMKHFFNKMEIECEDRIINIRDSFTYASVLRNKNCRYIDALDLYYNYIKPHSMDSGNSFRITHFIMNEILAKANSAGSFEKISTLFDENNVQRDKYSYNISLSNLDYNTCIKVIIPKMITARIDFDMYTLGELISKAPNVKVAVRYFKPLEALDIRAEDAGIPEMARVKVQEMIDGYTSDTADFPLERQHYFWAKLVGSHCRNDEDREVLHKVLSDFLETDERKERIFGELDNGKIYNNCLKNTSFIRSYEEAKEFIMSKGVKVDDYTFAFLQKFIIHDYKGTEELEFHLNSLYTEYKDLVISKNKKNETHFYNERLQAYHSQQETLNLNFIKPDGKVESKALTPLGYIRYLKENGLPFDVYTIYWYAKIKKDYTQEILEGFIDFIEKNGICLNYSCVDELYEGVKNVFSGKNCLEILRRLYSLRIKDEKLTAARVAVKMYSYDLYNLEEAFEMIKGNDIDKLYNYTQLFSEHRRKTKDNGDFKTCINLYTKHVSDRGITPNPDVFSSLANMAKTKEELEEVFDMMKQADINPINYFITPIMRVSQSIEDIEKLLKKYHGLQGKIIGGTGSEREVDAVLHGLVTLWRRKKDMGILEFTHDLKLAVLGQNNSSKRYAGHFPCLDIYVTSDGKLTQNALCELVNCWPCPDGDKDVKELYLSQTAELMTRYYKRGNDDINDRLITALKYVAREIRISNKEILNLLFPYPRLAFKFARSLDEIDYNEYKMLVESWNAGFDKLPEDYAIDTLIYCLKKINDTTIVDNIFNLNHWDEGVSVAHFLKEEDVQEHEYAMLTSYKENTTLRRISKKKLHSRNPSVANFISIYDDDLFDSRFLKSELETMCSNIKPKFDEMKPILDYVSGRQSCVYMVLISMADKILSYTHLCYVIEKICTENIKVSNELADKIVFSIVRKRHDDNKIRIVYMQLLEAVKNNNLSLSDLLCSPISVRREVLNRFLTLGDDWRAVCLLLHKMSSCPQGHSSTELLEYLEKVVLEYYKEGHGQKSCKIDSYVAQEFISQYIHAYNIRENKKSDDPQGSSMLNIIKTILSTNADSQELDLSIIFSQGFKEKVNRNDDWYKITSTDISRTILKQLKCTEEEKLDIVVNAGMHKMWWSTIYKGDFERLSKCGKTLIKYGLPDTDMSDYFTHLFSEADTIEKFSYALRAVSSKTDAAYTVDGDVLIGSMLKIIANDNRLIKALLNYNKKLKEKNGAEADLCKNLSWLPDKEFFKDVMGIDTKDNLQNFLDRSFPTMGNSNVKEDCNANSAIDNSSPTGWCSYEVSDFIYEIILMKDLRQATTKEEGYDIIEHFITNSSRRFKAGKCIANGKTISTYIEATKCAPAIIKQILTKTAYNASMIPLPAGYNDVFASVMDGHIFRELSRVIELNRNKGFSDITTQRLLHKLLLIHGSDFVLNDPEILLHVTSTLKSAEEYRMFILDLKKLYIPIHQELAAAMVQTLLRLAQQEPKNRFLQIVAGRVIALAEFESYHQGVDCHEFRAGYLLLESERKIDFKNFWAHQELHIDSAGTIGSTLLADISKLTLDDRMSCIFKIDNHILRYEAMLMMYSKNIQNINRKNRPAILENLKRSLLDMIEALDSQVPVNTLMRITDKWIKNELKIPFGIQDKVATGLIKYLAAIQKKTICGLYYRNYVQRVLNNVAKNLKYAVEKNLDRGRIYYSCFAKYPTNCKLYLECDTRLLKKLPNKNNTSNIQEPTA